MLPQKIPKTSIFPPFLLLIIQFGTTFTYFITKLLNKNRLFHKSKQLFFIVGVGISYRKEILIFNKRIFFPSSFVWEDISSKKICVKWKLFKIFNFVIFWRHNGGTELEIYAEGVQNLCTQSLMPTKLFLLSICTTTHFCK